MRSEDRFFQTLSEEELWQRYCGFLDLSLDKFMEIQEHLMTEQLKVVSGSPLGNKVMGGSRPRNIEEFRRTVPLTTYDDYEPYLSEQREDMLAQKPYLWVHSAGRRGRFKWIPQSSEIVEKAVRSYIGAFILASATRKGEVNIRPGFRVLTVLPPPPYTSGTVLHAMSQRITMRVIPPLDTGSSEFEERIRKGFQMALRDGVDIMGSVMSILVRMGEEFSHQTRGTRFSAHMLHPRVFWRLFRAWTASKLEGRSILPKDLWQPKGILAGGLDSGIYRDEVARYWGNVPFDLYAGTEALVYAMQSWNKKALTFLPDTGFLEFIPQDERVVQQRQANGQPATLLFNELEEGKSYEVVITHFYGMPLLRYRMNDVVKVAARKDDEAGIKLPQIVFQRRAGEVVNLANLAHIDAKTLWQAIVNTGVKHVDWFATKEFNHNQSFLGVYIELSEDGRVNDLAGAIDEQLKLVDPDYRDIDAYLHYQPVQVKLLPAGAFQKYAEERRKEGADLAQLKPARINPSEDEIRRFLELSQSARSK